MSEVLDVTLLVALINTRHVPDDDDAFADPARADQWVSTALDRPVRVDAAGRRRLQDLREGLRGWIRQRQAVAYGLSSPTELETGAIEAAPVGRHGRAPATIAGSLDAGPTPDELAATSARAEHVLAQTPLVLTPPEPTRPSRLRAAAPESGSIDEVVAAVAGALLTAQTTGTWTTLKTCADPDCQWAFLDTTKNQTRRWHSMARCGNRAKNRQYRDRTRTTAPPATTQDA